MSITDAKKRANKQWNSQNLEQVNIRWRKGTKEKIQQLSILSGESMAGYVLEAIRQRAERDGHADILSGGNAGADDESASGESAGKE